MADCRTGMMIQSFAFARNGWTEDTARQWLQRHGYAYDDLDVTANFLRFRQYDPSLFEPDSFRWGDAFRSGVSPIYACPRSDTSLGALDDLSSRVYPGSPYRLLVDDEFGTAIVIEEKDGEWRIGWEDDRSDIVSSLDDRSYASFEEAYPIAKGYQFAVAEQARSTWPPHGEAIALWSNEDPDFRQLMELYLFDTGRTDPLGKSVLAYRFYDGPFLVFQGHDFASSPLHAIDAPETVAALLGFLSLDKGDVEDDYFADYSPDQIEWRDERAEDLQAALLDFQIAIGMEEAPDLEGPYQIGSLTGGLGKIDPHLVVDVCRTLGKFRGRDLHRTYDRRLIARALAPIMDVGEEQIMNFLTRHYRNFPLKTDHELRELSAGLAVWKRQKEGDLFRGKLPEGVV